MSFKAKTHIFHIALICLFIVVGACSTSTDNKNPIPVNKSSDAHISSYSPSPISEKQETTPSVYVPSLMANAKESNNDENTAPHQESTPNPTNPPNPQKYLSNRNSVDNPTSTPQKESDQNGI